jgi:hypothetical protein
MPFQHLNIGLLRCFSDSWAPQLTAQKPISLNVYANSSSRALTGNATPEKGLLLELNVQ